MDIGKITRRHDIEPIEPAKPTPAPTPAPQKEPVAP